MREGTAFKEALRAGKEQQSPRKRMCRRPASVNSRKLKKFMTMEEKAVNFRGESETWSERPPKGTSLKRSVDHRNKGHG